LVQIIFQPENKIAHQVTFKGDLWKLFPEYQVILIALGGLIFELLLFYLSILLLKNQEKKLNTKMNTDSCHKILFLFLFFVTFGFYISFIRITISWLSDILGLLNHYSFTTVFKILILLSIAITIVSIWSLYFIRYFKTLPKISRKYFGKVNK